MTPPRKTGFTLVELIAVVAIIGILASLILPALGTMRSRAESTKCLANLRQIGIALHLAASENANRFPYIETDPDQPVYPPEFDAKGLLATLEPYGLTERGVQCPTDLRTTDYFARKGSSYEWRPYVDGESLANPQYFKAFGTWPVPLSLVRIASDYEPLHQDAMNFLYADGHVRTFDKF